LTKLQSVCIGFAGTLLALVAHAQPGKLQRIGVIHAGGPYEAMLAGLRSGLKEAGLAEGKQFVFHVRNTKGNPREVQSAAKQLESEQVDLLVAITSSSFSPCEASYSSCADCLLRG
jgi:ABC-type uncharacterized transport system substrate-binding protein